MSLFAPSYAALAVAWLNQDAKGRSPARTFLVGAGLLDIQQRRGEWRFDVTVSTALATDNSARVMEWFDDRLYAPDTLLLWKPETRVIPALVAAAQSSPDLHMAAQMLRRLDRALDGTVVNVAALVGGGSLDAAAAELGCAATTIAPDQLAAAYASGDELAVRSMLAEQAIAIWRLWLARQSGQEALAAATAEWLKLRADAQAVLP